MSKESPGELQLARFRLADGRYGIEIMKVREVVNPMTITPIPGSPKFLEGVVELRGDFLPVIDLRARMGLATGPDFKIVIAMAHGRRLGLIVDQVYDVFRTHRESMQPLDQLAQSAALAGIIHTDDGAVLVIDPDGLLSDLELGQLAELSPAV